MDNKKEIFLSYGLRQRRKIYESAINLVGQTRKIQDANWLMEQPMLKKMMKAQKEECVEIIQNVLGYTPVVRVDNNVKHTVLVSEGEKFELENDQFLVLIDKLPTDKNVKETLWKASVKGKAAAIEKLNMI